MPLLRPGDSFSGVYSRQNVEVLRNYASGGQAEIYVARWDGREYALKWYKPIYRKADQELRSRLRMLIQRGAPSSYFLWPEELVERGDEFGYLMPLARADYQPLSFLLSGRLPHYYSAAINAGLLLAENMRLLHAGGGLCYRDISDGNVLYRPDDGDIRIIDNDNVSVDGTPARMLGTASYMPPEVVLRKVAASKYSDLHALAVLLFRLLVRHHPLLGSFQDDDSFIGVGEDERDRVLYGERPLFIFDPDDVRNRPDPQQDRVALLLWPGLPAFIKRTFIKVFTVGLKNAAQGRVQNTTWMQDLARLRDRMFPCPGCGAQVFYDEERMMAEGRLANCWQCGVNPASPPRLRAGSHIVVLGDGARLYPHHLHGAMGFQLAAPAGEVRDGTLRNLSDTAWAVTLCSGGSERIEPGGGCRVANLGRINFGRTMGDVER